MYQPDSKHSTALTKQGCQLEGACWANAAAVQCSAVQCSAVQCSTAGEACTAVTTHHFRRMARVNTLLCHHGSDSRHIEAPRGHQTLQHGANAAHRCEMQTAVLFCCSGP
jgi:hypothetical protein